MLFSIALAPGVLRPPAAHTPSLAKSLSAVLLAVWQNGIIIFPDPTELCSDFVHTVGLARDSGADRLAMLAEILKNNVERFSLSKETPPRGSASPADPYARCVAAARWCKCDAVVVSDEHERQRCLENGYRRDRIVMLEDFVGSVVDRKRSEWLAAQRLDTLGHQDASTLVGGAIRFAKKIVVADKMIGVSTKQDAAKVREHLRGVAYLVDTWIAETPHDPKALEVEILSVAGGSGARAGYISVTETEQAITDAMSKLGTLNRIGCLTITLKKDGKPQIFNDRLLKCGTRVWGIHHGFDDIGRLRNTTTNRRRPTRIEPASDALATTFRDIQALQDATPMEVRAS